MPSYRELLEQTKTEIDEIDAGAARALDGAVWIDVREADEWQEGHIPGAVHIPRGHLESRVEAVAPDKSAPVVLYCASAARSAFAAKSLEEPRLRERPLARRRVHRLEAQRPRDHDAADALAGAPHALLAPHPDPRDRRGGPAQAARRAHPPDRRRRARLSRVALPRGGGRRHARDRRRRHRRRDEPAAADRALARHARHAEGRLREGRDRGAQSRRRTSSPTASGSPRRTSTGSSTTAGTSSSTAPTTSPRATS